MSSAIDVLLSETRTFPPDPAFTDRAVVRSREPYDDAARDSEAFWAAEASRLEWITPWRTVLD